MNVSFSEEEVRIISKFLHAMEKQGSYNARGLSSDDLELDHAWALIDAAREGERFLDDHQGKTNEKCN